MYRDSQLGLCIDIRGPEGNVFALMGHASNLAKQIGKDEKKIITEMSSADYEHAVRTFNKYFGDTVTLIGLDDIGIDLGATNQ